MSRKNFSKFVKKLLNEYSLWYCVCMYEMSNHIKYFVWSSLFSLWYYFCIISSLCVEERGVHVFFFQQVLYELMVPCEMSSEAWWNSCGSVCDSWVESLLNMWVCVLLAVANGDASTPSNSCITKVGKTSKCWSLIVINIHSISKLKMKITNFNWERLLEKIQIFNFKSHCYI